jgi:hypothetical protein
VNVLRLSLHPQGLAPRIRNLPEWRAHLLDRLRRQIDASSDPHLIALQQELRALSAPDSPAHVGDHPAASIAVPMQLEVDGAVLCLFSTTTVFGTPVDITLAELALEAFVPADGGARVFLVANHEHATGALAVDFGDPELFGFGIMVGGEPRTLRRRSDKKYGAGFMSNTNQ